MEPRTQRPRIADVAREAGVSKTAVSFAFNSPDRLAPETASRIRDVADSLGYRPHPVARTALVYAGAQKNLGPAGVVVTIVRKDLYDRIDKKVPKIFSFKALAEAKSCLNTPPTFGVYFLLETFKWIEAQGGLAAIEKPPDASMAP